VVDIPGFIAFTPASITIFESTVNRKCGCRWILVFVALIRFRVAYAIAEIFDDRRALADAAGGEHANPWMGECRTSNSGVRRRLAVFFIRRWGLDGVVMR